MDFIATYKFRKSSIILGTEQMHIIQEFKKMHTDVRCWQNMEWPKQNTNLCAPAPSFYRNKYTLITVMGAMKF